MGEIIEDTGEIGSTDVLFMMVDQQVKVAKEVASYDLNSFIGDVGGFLGLLLGLTLPDIYDRLIFLASKFRGWITEKRKQRTKK